MNLKNLSLVAIAALAFTTNAHATLKNDKITLKGNMIVEYNALPKPVETFKEAFSEGMFYGRLRSNAFYFDWQNEEKNSGAKDQRALGVGGSLIYKSAPLHGLSTTFGLYTSQNPTDFNVPKEDIGTVKSGKDVFSRYDTQTTRNYGMTVVGQAYLQYDVAKTKVVGGRQMFESVFTKSNDTKMIPNTFDGITAEIKDIPKTTIQLAYLAKQKLRDHTTSHDVLAYQDDDSSTTDINENWTQNDDGAVNKSLTTDLIGDNNYLLIATATNKSVENLKANVSFAAVPDVLSNLVLEAHYTIPVGGEWSVAPGVRYMQQFDNLSKQQHDQANAATGGVANLAAKNGGYKNPNSLDTNLIAARLDIQNKAFLARLGYSHVADEADLVAPWRGFPTGGFTRAMAQYNWNANTTTYMLRAGYDFGKANIVDGFSIMARYAIQDFDDNKPGVQADSNIVHIDARQNLGKNLEAKLRLGFVSSKDDIVPDGETTAKKDVSYNEYRFELNYFF